MLVLIKNDIKISNWKIKIKVKFWSICNKNKILSNYIIESVLSSFRTLRRRFRWLVKVILGDKKTSNYVVQTAYFCHSLHHLPPLIRDFTGCVKPLLDFRGEDSYTLDRFFVSRSQLSVSTHSKRDAQSTFLYTSMAGKLMHAVQYYGYGGGPAGLKVIFYPPPLPLLFQPPFWILMCEFRYLGHFRSVVLR